MSLDLSRREFMQVGSVSALTLGSTGSLQIQGTEPTEEYEYQGVADLMGPSDARPAPGSDFFDNKVYYWYRYQAKDTGARSYIDDSRSKWKELPLKAPKVATDELNGGVTGSLSVGKIFGERIESQSPSGTSAAEFTTGINSDYNRYIFDLTDVIPSQNSDTLQVQVSTDGGATWESGATDYRWFLRMVADDTGERTHGSSGDSVGRIAEDVGNDTNEGIEATMTLSNPAGSDVAQYIRSEHTYTFQGGELQGGWARVAYKTPEAIDGFRFKFAGNNIKSGHIDLLGVMS